MRTSSSSDEELLFGGEGGVNIHAPILARPKVTEDTSRPEGMSSRTAENGERAKELTGRRDFLQDKERPP